MLAIVKTIYKVKKINPFNQFVLCIQEYNL